MTSIGLHSNQEVPSCRSSTCHWNLSGGSGCKAHALRHSTFVRVFDDNLGYLQVERDTMIAKHVLNVHRTAGNQPERDDNDKKVPLAPSGLGAQHHGRLWAGQMSLTVLH